MATASIKATIETYFKTNWTSTSIQYEGAPFDYDGKSSWISLVYIPVANDQYAMDGTSTGRISYAAMLKVFCYAKSSTLAYSLADSVKTFLNGKQLTGDIQVEIGQDRGANDLDNGYFEVPCLFNFIQYS